jgi:uncharacterized membrane protein YjjP (DUF1212 family)
VADDETLTAMTCSLRAGQVMLESSVSVSEVTDVMLRLTRAFGLDRCEVSITLNTITMCNLPGPHDEPMTMIKVVDIGEPRLDRLASVETLTGLVESGELGPTQTYRRLQDIEDAPVPYPRWATFVAALVSVAAWVVFAGGGAVAATAGVIGAVIIDPLVRIISRSRMPQLTSTFAAAIVVVLVPNLILATGVEIALSAAIIGGLYPLLPGGALVASATDGLSGAPLSGLAKGLQAAVIALVLGLGVAVAQSLVDALEITGDTTEVAIPALGTMVAAGVAVCALAVARGMPAGALVPTTLIAVVAWAITYLAPSRGMGATAATLVAAVAIGVAGQLVARLQHKPGTLYTTSAVYVLVPGTAIYLAMNGFAMGDTEVAGEWLIIALRTATAIAAGIAVGVALGRSVPSPRPRVALWRRTRNDRIRGR